MKQHKKLISVLLVLALVLALCVSFAFASTGSVPKNLEYMDLKIKLNGTLITPKNEKGSVVEPFAIEGTTYLPIRAIAGALGLDVGWDGATKTVVLNSPELSAAEIFQKCSPSVVHIETTFGGGTGFFIEENIVATNNHVINGAWSATVKTVDGQIFNVIEVLAATENPDLALLRVDGKGTPVTLNTQCAEMGEALYSIGAPMGIFPTISTGIVANNTHTDNGTGFYLSNINTLSGNSGGPIFNSRGEVVGVMQGGITDGLNSLDMIIKVAHVLEMDRSNPFELTPPPPDEENYTHAASLKSAEVGQLVSFGRYEQDADPSTTDEDILWLVIGRNGSELKLMSLYCLDMVHFMTDDSPVLWANSYARAFLNNDFYNRAFSAAEQTKIKTVSVKNTPNPVYGTGGGENTLDKVYLFSLEEAMEYYNIPNPEETFYDGVYAQATPYTIEKGAWLEIPGSTNCWWWLRSTGSTDQHATEIGSAGYLSFNGTIAHIDQRAIRPIIHIEAK